MEYLLLGRKVMTNLDSILESRDTTLPTKVHLVKAMVFPVVMYGLWRMLSTEKLMLLNCGVGEDSWESLGLHGEPTSPSWRRSVLGVHWKDWCWSWNSNTLATWYEELTHWKRPWCWEELGAGGEGGNRGWDGWMASLTQWTWVWVSSRSWWWTGRPGMLWFMGSQSVRHDWATELTKLNNPFIHSLSLFSAYAQHCHLFSVWCHLNIYDDFLLHYFLQLTLFV